MGVGMWGGVGLTVDVGDVVGASEVLDRALSSAVVCGIPGGVCLGRWVFL